MSFSTQEIFAAMEAAMPKIKGKFPAKIVVMTVGNESFLVDAKNGKVVPTESDTRGDLNVTVSLETLMMLLQKKMTPQQAFMKGLLKIKGKMGLAMKLTVILNATRSNLPTPKL